MPRFVLRVDDCGWKPEDKSADYGLEYFKRWRSALRSTALPVYYGFIPTFTHKDDLSVLSTTLTGRERLAVHGHDHARNAVVTLAEMQAAHIAFDKTPAYIPPFNHYDNNTMRNWVAAIRGNTKGSAIFFGGFDEANGNRHHTFGDVPVSLFNGDLLHLPAMRKYYDRAPALTESAKTAPDLPVPIVLTLHATWDVYQFAALGQLMDVIRPHLIGEAELYSWQRRSTLDISQLTAPHFVAYNWVVDHIRDINIRVLDFGSRYSLLPAQMAIRGARVTATDRDPELPAMQRRACQSLGDTAVSVDTYGWDGLTTPNLEEESFDVVSACWAIQHNLGDREIETVSRNLYRLLKKGGKAAVVTSREAKQTRVDRGRKDPQVILSDADFVTRVVESAGWSIDRRQLFQYVHASRDYKLDAAPEDANAACYTLIK